MDCARQSASRQRGESAVTINREILKIALPAIVANIAEPLLGLLDTAIAGHLGAARFIGAAAVGAMMLNVIYWHFEFLRMGTSGLTAQAHGAGSADRQAQALQRSVMLALVAGLALLVLQWPLRVLVLWVISPSPDVYRLASLYFDVAIWGAPAVLVTMSVKGWLLGRQDSRSPMLISIGVNVLNVAVSLLAVYALGMGFVGIAVGTLVAVWSGVFYALWLVARRHGEVSKRVTWLRLRSVRLLDRRFFALNTDIFVRSLFMMVVTLFFTSAGARSGDVILAVNSMMIQLFLLYSYFMDGFAFAGEAVAGKYYGARRMPEMRRCVRLLFLWALAITVPFTLAYTLFPHRLFTLFTDLPEVARCAMDYRWWCALVPIAGMAAFVWDGVFVGLTRTRGMLTAVATAAAVFFALYFLLPSSLGNHKLWIAFVTFLAMRGTVQTLLYRRFSRSL